MKKGLVLVLLTAIISGISIFLNAFGVKDINPYLFTGAKNLIVSIFLLSTILLLGNFRELKTLKLKDWQNLGLIGLIGGSIPFLLFFKGLQLASPAQGSFVHKTMIIWVALLSIFVLKEKLDKKIVVGALLLLVGNFLLLKLTSFEFTTGIGLIVIATLFWSSEIILSKKVLEKLSGNVVAFGRMFFGSLFILIFLIATNQISLVATITTSQLVWIGVTSVFLVGYVMTFYNGLKLVKASTAVAVLSLGAVITTLLNVVFLDKVIGLSQVIGMIFLVIGAIAFSISTETLKKIYSSISTAKA
ncbi:MAG: DMT family transporter [archaeon]